MTVPLGMPLEGLSPQLDLARYVGQRSATFTFTLIDAITGENLGDVNPIRRPPTTLTHDTARTVKRTLSPVAFGQFDARRINPIRQRIEVAMVVAGATHPLGRYMFTDATALQWTSGDLMNTSLVDEMFIIDQEMEQSFTVDVGNDESVDAAIRRLLLPIPNLDLILEPSPLQATGSWAAGTSRAKALEDLCTQGGYFSPWFDNLGRLRIIQAFEPAESIPNFDLDAGNTVIRGSIATTNDLLSAPNRFVVISNGTQGSAAQLPAVGTYDVPNGAPHSILNRGFVIPDVRDIQVSSSAQAFAAARTLGIRQTIFERVDLATSPDPRHDSYDVVRWDGELWLELSWSLTLSEGAPMRHVMRKAYS